jgi:hypothetical protein
MAKSEPVQCAVCGLFFERRAKGGEISITLRSTSGGAVTVAGPICSECAEKSASDPQVALNQMRTARAFLLAGLAKEVRHGQG